MFEAIYIQNDIQCSYSNDAVVTIVQLTISPYDFILIRILVIGSFVISKCENCADNICFFTWSGPNECNYRCECTLR